MATYDEEYDVVLVCSAVNMASAALLMCKTAMELEKQSKKRKHSCLLVGSDTPNPPDKSSTGPDPRLQWPSHSVSRDDLKR